MASYIPQIETVTYDRIGFASLPLYYELNDTKYYCCAAVKDSNNNIVAQDSYFTSQFGGLTPNTNYILCSCYMDENGVIVGEIPDTEVSFTTHTYEFYTPVVESKTETSITISSIEDSLWESHNVNILGFGIGVELSDSNGNIVGSTTTPYEFTGLTTGETYTIKPYVWTGKASGGTFKNYVKGVEVVVVLEEEKKPSLNVIPTSTTNEIDLAVTLSNFTNPAYMIVLVNNKEIINVTEDLANGTYNIKLTDLDEQTTYEIEVRVFDQDKDTLYTYTTSSTTKSEVEDVSTDFKDFWIAVGQPGAYSNSMEYSEVFGMNERFNIKIKHAPYSPMAKIKNVVVQSWKDEHGDDVWLPRAHDAETGTYIPAVTHEAVDYNPVFVIFGDKDIVNSNQTIRDLLKLIEGKWLKIWDEYTQMGFEGVYLVDIDDDPKFKRRNYDHVQFTLKFKINGTNIDSPFEGVGA